MPSLDRAGLALHYERTGAGAPLLLIAGLASDSASWLPVVEHLAGFDLVMPDNRGVGRTRPVAPFAFPEFADDLVRLLDALALERVAVVGHSMGGMIALDLAHRHPARVDRLVLAATATGPEPRAAAVFAALARARHAGLTDEHWLRLFHPWLFGPDFFRDPARNEAAIAAALAYPHQQSPEGYLAQLRATAGLDLAAIIPAIPHPTLVLTAEHDLIFPPALSAAAFAPLPNARAHTIAGAGHALHWDAPAAFAGAVARFLA